VISVCLCVQARKAKEKVLREKIVSIRKRAKEIVQARTEGTLEHLQRADQKLADLKIRTKRTLDVKNEIERLRYEQVLLGFPCLCARWVVA
jgi:hypothetical protein